MGQESIVALDCVTRTFGPVKAVDGLSLTLAPGEVMGFLGTNGAGKTTTIKMILGLIAPSGGRVSVFGGDPSDPSVRARIGYMPEVATYYPYLNARELLSFYGGICGLDSRTVRERTDGLLESVGLADAAKRPLRTYSKGMLQRAADTLPRTDAFAEGPWQGDILLVARAWRDGTPLRPRGDHEGRALRVPRPRT